LTEKFKGESAKEIKNLPYLHKVIQETLRMTAPFRFLPEL
jgi:cytochrome P450